MADRTVKLGGFTLASLDAGEFLYDGGAMFGAVPKIIWEGLVPCDDQNRIALSLSPLLIESDARKILVDVGFGERHTKRDLKVFGFDPARNVAGALARRGLSPDDIDTVVLTHLHCDHAAGATRRGATGLEPAFPNARYLVNALEWEDALSPDVRSAAAYRADDFVPLREAGRVDLVGDVHEVADGVSMIRTGGHTRGHAMVVVRADEGTAVYPADLIPIRHHARVPYIAGIDTFPLDMIEQKEKLLNEAVDGDWIVILDHDTEGNVGRIVRDDRGRFAFRDIEARGAIEEDPRR
jgi:glyoxylase-like metal-dependent hydrolase (beta-lactamase superfamily II)